MAIRTTLASSVLLASCAATPGAVVTVQAPPPEAAITAGALARVAEDVCLAAQAAGERTPVFIEQRGPAPLGLRPAPPPGTGWVATGGPPVSVGEWQTACFASLTEPPVATTEALLAALAAPVGSYIERERRAAEGALVRRVCRAGTTLSVIEGVGADGRPVLGVAVPPRPLACAPLAPPVPTMRGEQRGEGVPGG